MIIGIIFAFFSMLANSAYDISMQQKAVVIKGDKNWFLLVAAVVSLVLSLIISLFDHNDIFRVENLIYGLICGVLAFIGYYTFLLSMEGENRSVYIIFIRLSFILSILYSFLILNDRVTLFKILALLFCCSSMVVLSLNKKKIINSHEKKHSSKRIFEDKYLLITILSCFFLAATNIVNKYAVKANVDVFAVLFWRYVTSSFILFIIILSKSLLKRNLSFNVSVLVKSLNIKFYVFSILAGIMILLSTCAIFEALKYTDISIVLPISQLSFVVVILFNKFLYKEKMHMKKYIGVILAILAIIFIMIN